MKNHDTVKNLRRDDFEQHCPKNEVFHYLIKRQSCYHIETSQLICSANQLTGFYMMATLVFNELRISSVRISSYCKNMF